MNGTVEMVKEEISSHKWPSTPHVDADKPCFKIPEIQEESNMSGLTVLQSGPSSWGLDRIDDSTGLDNDYTTQYDGSGVHVYVIDTGIRTTHTDFEGRAIPTLEVLGSGEKKCKATETTCAMDNDGHGTHCAGTIGGKKYGVAKKATLHAVKVLTDDGRG